VAEDIELPRGKVHFGMVIAVVFALAQVERVRAREAPQLVLYLVPVLCGEGRTDDAGSELVEALKEDAVLLRCLIARKLHDGVAVVRRDLLDSLVQECSGLSLLVRGRLNVLWLLAHSPGIYHVLQAQQRCKVVEGRT